MTCEQCDATARQADEDYAALAKQCIVQEAEIAQLRQHVRDETNARLTEVEHWVKRYNELEIWRQFTLQRALAAEQRVKELTR